MTQLLRLALSENATSHDWRATREQRLRDRLTQQRRRQVELVQQLLQEEQQQLQQQQQYKDKGNKIKPLQGRQGGSSSSSSLFSDAYGRVGGPHASCQSPQAASDDGGEELARRISDSLLALYGV